MGMNDKPLAKIHRLSPPNPSAEMWREIGAIFEARATREHKLSVDLKINGRRDLASVHLLRASICDEAAAWCRARAR
jgi:hypothetical protein